MNNFGSTKREYFYIASGELNKMYVLRYFCHEEWFAYDNSGENQTDHHVRNLSIDWKKAVAKANEYVKSVNANRAKKIKLLGEPVVLDKIVRKDKEAIAQEKAEKLAKKEFWARVNAERNNNFVYACWGTYMANSCKKFAVKQQGGLDTDQRVTLVGTIKSVKQYLNTFSYHESYVYKSLIELDSGHKVFGSLPNFDTALDVGDRIQFDAKLEEPKDSDETFYYYKRPTKVKLLNQVKECA